MDALRSTINTQGIKTKQIVFQYPDGSFPEAGAILNVTDTRGHTDWTRAPNLDSITLVDASGNEGVVSYTDVSGLLVNNIPVGGGGGGVGTGGTNIDVTGLGVINFTPNKTPAGVDMLGAPMTNTSRVGFTTDALITTNGSTAQKAFHTTNATLGITNTQYLIGDYNNTMGMNGGGVKYDTATKLLSVNNPAFAGLPIAGQGIAAVGSVKSIVGTNTTELNGIQLNYNSGSKNATLRFDPTSTNGTLELTNTTSDPQLRISTTGAAASITASTEASTKINTIAMATTGGTGISQITMTDGVASANVSFLGATDKLEITSSNNLSMISGPNQAIEMGTLAAQLALLTNDNRIILRRNSAGGTVNKTQLTVGDAGVIQLGEADVSSNPCFKFQQFGGGSASTQLQMDASDALVISGSAGATAQIAMPLRDGSGAVGTAGQVLTAQASGPPLWAAGGGGGGSVSAGTNISVSGSTVSFDPSGGVNMLLNDISGAGSVSISDGTETALLDISGQNLFLSSSTAAGFTIGVPLVDVATGTAGSAGQILTTDGVSPPYWASSGAPVIIASNTYTSLTPASTININNAEFSAIPSTGITNVRIQITIQGGGGGGGGGLAFGSPSGGGIMTSGGGGGGGAGYSQTLQLDVSYNALLTYTIGSGGNGGAGNQILVSGTFDAAAGASGGTTQVVTPIGTYSVVGGGGGGGGSGTGGAQAGGAGSSPGTAGSFSFSGPGASTGDDGAGNVWGGVGGGTYGGTYGDGTGGALFSPAVATAGMYGGQVIPTPPLAFPSYSGAGGGGGGGGAGSYAQNGGPGAQGYMKVDILTIS
jgi:hypothetical protein